MWFDKLLACLEAYCWFIGNDTLSASQLLAGRYQHNPFNIHVLVVNLTVIK